MLEGFTLEVNSFKTEGPRLPGPVVYFQQEFPKPSETFITAELSEFYKKHQDLWVTVCRPNQELLSNLSFKDRVVAASQGLPLVQQLEEIFQGLQQIKPCYVHAHFVTEAARIVLPLVQGLGIPFGFTCHAADLWKRGNRLEPEELSALGNHPLCIAAATIGNYHVRYLERCGIPKDKIVITPNCVDSSHLPGIKTAPPSGIKKLVCVGRPTVKKGFPVAIDAVRLLRLSGYEVELEIVGGGDASDELGRQIAAISEQFPFVTATGMQPYQKTLEAIYEADALIAPCMIAPDGDSDGVPTVLAEAMLMGVPVVTTDVASIPDLVIDGETGFLARVGDPASLAEKIIELNSLLAQPDKAVAFLAQAKRHAGRNDAENSVGRLIEHLAERLRHAT